MKRFTVHFFLVTALLLAGLALVPGANASPQNRAANSSAMPTPKTIRQQIVDTLTLRLQRISVANGFQTELGVRPIEDEPVAEQFEDLPAVGIYDLDNEVTQTTLDEGLVPNELPIQVRFFVAREETPANVRIYIADVKKAIITHEATGERDPTFGGLLTTILPTNDGKIRDKETFQVDAGAVGFVAKFFTEPFNDYE